MANKLIELDSFSAPPHAKHVFAKREGDIIRVHLMDLYYNNQGSLTLTVENAKLFIREIMDELYGEGQDPQS